MIHPNYHRVIVYKEFVIENKSDSFDVILIRSPLHSRYCIKPYWLLEVAGEVHLLVLASIPSLMPLFPSTKCYKPIVISGRSAIGRRLLFSFSEWLASISSVNVKGDACPAGKSVAVDHSAHGWSQKTTNVLFDVITLEQCDHSAKLHGFRNVATRVWFDMTKTLLCNIPVTLHCYTLLFIIVMRVLTFWHGWWLDYVRANFPHLNGITVNLWKWHLNTVDFVKSLPPSLSHPLSTLSLSLSRSISLSPLSPLSLPLSPALSLSLPLPLSLSLSHFFSLCLSLFLFQSLPLFLPVSLSHRFSLTLSLSASLSQSLSFSLFLSHSITLSLPQNMYLENGVSWDGAVVDLCFKYPNCVFQFEDNVLGLRNDTFLPTTGNQL